MNLGAIYVAADRSLKKVIKSVVLETLEENRDPVRAIIEEAIEDAFMTRAIKDGRRTRKVSKRRVLAALSESR